MAFVPFAGGAQPASAASAGVQIGEVVPAEKLHIISYPGRYGLGPEVPGSLYAVVGDQLIRIDAQSHKVQSIIRQVTEILD